MIHDKIDIKACFVLQNGHKFISVPSLSFKKELSTNLAGSHPELDSAVLWPYETGTKFSLPQYQVIAAPASRYQS